MTTDLSSKTVGEMTIDELVGCCRWLPLNTPERQICERAAVELARRLEEAQQKIVAQEAKDNYVGRWLSATLDDPSVCEGMKADIRLWMASDAVALAAHDAKVAAEALERFADYVGSELPEAHSAHIEDDCRRMAAEYRAKAGRKE